MASLQYRSEIAPTTKAMRAPLTLGGAVPTANGIATDGGRTSDTTAALNFAV